MSSRASLQTLLALAVFAGCADDSGITTVQPQDAEEFVSESPWDQRSPLRVMSRNLYLGGDIGPILDASNPADIPLLVAETWATIRATDFPQRARLIKQEIAAARPDVIGLQEVALFRTQSPGDFLVGNPQPAEEVAFDYLDILLSELQRRGLRYEVATSVENIDVELPAATSPTTFDDVRFTDRDVVLVRKGVQIDVANSGHYSINLSFPVAGAIPITILRGCNRVDLTHRGTRYHFVNTHLETDESGAVVQQIQAAELVEMLADVPVPTLLVGDLNGMPEGETNTHSTLLEAGFEDSWSSAPTRKNHSGFTCCFDPDLRGGELFERIDYVFARGSAVQQPRVHSVRLVGDGPFAGTRSASRPSDHAGLVASVSFPPPPPDPASGLWVAPKANRRPLETPRPPRARLARPWQP